MLFTSDYSIKMPLGQTILTALLGIVTVLFILAVIAALIMIVSKIVRTIERKMSAETVELTEEIVSEQTPKEQEKPQGVPLPETQSQGDLSLVGVDEPTAAVIMALVSYQSGIALNRLSFKSIRLLPEDEKK